jgi:hypothetical protein
MYLNAKKYVGANDSVSVEGVPDAGDLKLKELKYEGMYWRKANAIHAWFVENVQAGVDDCKEYYVEREQLEELMNLCASVIADPDRAGELLPPQGGFFFGAAEVDDWYWENVKRTYEELKQLLQLLENGSWWSFSYDSSW